MLLLQRHLLNAVCFFWAAGHATESFSDFVVGHGELWSAQMLAAVVRKVQWLSACCCQEYMFILTLGS